MKPGLRWLYVIALAGLLLEPSWLTGETQAGAPARAQWIAYNVGSLPAVSDLCAQQTSVDDTEKKDLEARQQKQALMLWFLIVSGTTLDFPASKTAAWPELAPLHRSHALSAEYLIRGPPAQS